MKDRSIVSSGMWVCGLAAVLLTAAGCGGAQSNPVAPSPAVAAGGTWSGRSQGVEPTDWSMTLSQSGTTVNGTGTNQGLTDKTTKIFDVTGSFSTPNLNLTIQIRPTSADPVRPAISYVATISGNTITGTLNGGNIQHDGPFVNTALVLTK